MAMNYLDEILGEVSVSESRGHGYKRKARQMLDDDSVKVTYGERYLKVWDFMLFYFKLEKTELLVYAIVFSMYKAKSTYYSGSREYLSLWTGSSPRAVSNALKSLVDKGLITVSKKRMGQTIRKVYAVNTEKLPTCQEFELENKTRDIWAKADEKKRARGEPIESRVPEFYPEDDDEDFTEYD